MSLCVNLFTFKSQQTLCKNKQSQFGFRKNILTSENLLILKSVLLINTFIKRICVCGVEGGGYFFIKYIHSCSVFIVKK